MDGETDFRRLEKGCIGRDEPEAQADLLLRRANAGFGEYPAYTECYLAARDTKHGRELSIEDAMAEYGIEIPSLETLGEMLFSEIMRTARRLRFTVWEIDALGWLYKGFTRCEIALIMDCDRGTVADRLERVGKRLEAEPYFGLITLLARAVPLPKSSWLGILRLGEE